MVEIHKKKCGNDAGAKLATKDKSDQGMDKVISAFVKSLAQKEAQEREGEREIRNLEESLGCCCSPKIANHYHPIIVWPSCYRWIWEL